MTGINEQDIGLHSSPNIETFQFLPSLEDRRNFLACLATVLASRYSYEYELVDSEQESCLPAIEESIGGKDAEGGKEISLQREISLKGETTENDSVIKKNSPKPNIANRKNLWKTRSDADVGNNCKENLLQRESSLKGETVDSDSAIIKNSPTPSITNRKNLWKRPSDAEGGNNCKENLLQRESSLKSSEIIDNDSASKKNLQKSNVTNRKTLRKRSSSLSISLEKKIQVQNQRYRKRRHEVLSELLKSAGELLYLDDQNTGECYIPLLDRLLLPPIIVKPMNSFDSGSVDGGSIDEYGTDEICNDKQSGLNNIVLNSSPAGDAECIRHDNTITSANESTQSELANKSNSEYLGNDVDHNEPMQSNSDRSKESLIKEVNSCEMENDNNQCMQLGEESDNNQCIHLGEESIESIRTYNPYSRIDILNSKLDEIISLRPIIESLTPGSGTRCLAIFLLRHLLQSKTGYDARIRHCIKILGVIIFLYDCTDDYIDEQQMKMDFSQYATKNFEAFERLIANHLLQLSTLSSKSDSVDKDSADLRTEKPKQANRRRSNIIKGFQIGGAAVAAGVLFAVTAGMAAPAIAAGVAVIASATTITASAAALLTTHLAVSTIFGVGGGSLAAYKMKRRVCGLTEFVIHKEEQGEKVPRYVDKQPLPPVGKDSNKADTAIHDTTSPSKDRAKPKIDPELYSTVCISGWLNDMRDFQRPWGVTPTKPPIRDRVEILQRFFAIHDQCRIREASKLRKAYNTRKQNWGDLCHVMQKEYGRDPDHLFPLDNDVKTKACLNTKQQFIFESLFFELGYSPTQPSPLQCEEIKGNETDMTDQVYDIIPESIENVKQTETLPENLDDDPSDAEDERSCISTNSVASDSSNSQDGQNNSRDMSEDATLSEEDFDDSDADDENQNLTGDNFPKHILTVWDYQTTYGGELYTIRWESRLMKEISDSIKQLAFDIVNNTTYGLMRLTVLSGLLAALTVPVILAGATSLIDGPWTLAANRADEAGKELARCLLVNNAGNRPITLIGFSFGARVIYSCLKELAVYQQKWEENRVVSHSTTHAKEMKSSREAKITEEESPKSGKSRPRWGRKMKNKDEMSPLTQSMASEEVHAKDKSSLPPKAGDLDTSLELPREPASIVEDVIMLGLPDRFDALAWESCRQVVAGRFVNGYSQKDWVLSLMYRVKQVGLKPVCGTCAVNAAGIENIDLTDMLQGHQDYLYKIGPILERINHTQPFRCIPSSYRSTDTKAVAEEFEDK